MARISENERKKRKIERVMMAGVVVLMAVTTILCSYGYAAFETDLQISGEGGVNAQINFSSTYMQEMTSAECAKVDVGQTKQLIDKRDGKKYWVAKMKDGGCWMTQNLALTFGSEAGKVNKLEPTLSDVQTTWTPTPTTMAVPPAQGADNNGTNSWNLGEIILTNPTGSERCPRPADVPDRYDDSYYNSAYYGQQITQTCPQFFRSATGLQPSFSATATNSLSSDGSKYDAHYLIGNFYQWNAATAGTGKAVGGAGDATSSVCPKGWKLPTNAQQIALIDAYEGKGADVFNYRPLYFVRNGYIIISTGALRNAGFTSLYWASTAQSSTRAYHVTTSDSTATANSYNARAYGCSVRCVAR